MDLNKSKANISCMTIKAMKNIQKEKKKKNKWSEELLKLFFPKKTLRNKSHFKTLPPKSYQEKEPLVLFYLWRGRKRNNFLQ